MVFKVQLSLELITLGPMSSLRRNFCFINLMGGGLHHLLEITPSEQFFIMPRTEVKRKNKWVARGFESAVETFGRLVPHATSCPLMTLARTLMRRITLHLSSSYMSARSIPLLFVTASINSSAF